MKRMSLAVAILAIIFAVIACENPTAEVPKSSDANLSALTISAGTMGPVFSAGTLAYSVNVANGVSSITVTGIKADAGATVSGPVTLVGLAVGATETATITVTAANGATKTYTVSVTVLPSDYTSANIGTLKGVPEGTFQRDATATNTTTVSAFRIAQNEITRAQFVAMLVTDPSSVSVSVGTDNPVQNLNWYHAIAYCNKLSIAEGLEMVYTVSAVDFTTLAYAGIPTTNNTTWNAATANLNATGYRLPTLSEWQWAAMGALDGTNGYKKPFPGSNGTNDVHDYVYYYETSFVAQKTQAVGSMLPNELNVYDLSGSVGEWVWDFFGQPSDGPVTDYQGASSGNRTVVGGGWRQSSTAISLNFPLSLVPTAANDYTGIRLVRR